MEKQALGGIPVNLGRVGRSREKDYSALYVPANQGKDKGQAEA